MKTNGNTVDLEISASPPWDELDEGIEPLVRLLHTHGYSMYSSCEGGPGHHFETPTVVVWAGLQEMTAIRSLLHEHGYTNFEIRYVASHDYYPEQLVIILDNLPET